MTSEINAYNNSALPIETINEQEILRTKLHYLIRTKFAGDNWKAATVISKFIGKHISTRSIQAWLISPERKSSRTCPAWAVDALDRYVQAESSINQAVSEQPMSWQVLNQRSVDIADAKLAHEERQKERWKDVPLSSLATQISEMEIKHEDHLNYLNGQLVAIQRALRESNSFDEYKQRVLYELNEASILEHVIFKTKKDISQCKDEFANNEVFNPSNENQS